MNIFLSSISGNELTESRYFLSQLRKLGHNVFFFSAPSNERKFRGTWAETGYSVDVNFNELIEIAGFTPDLFIYIEPFGLIPRGMENAPCPTACILCDTHMDLAVRVRQSLFFDYVFLYHRNYLKYFKHHPSDSVSWLPYACDTDFFTPTGAMRDIDLAFIGQPHPWSERGATLRKLEQRYAMNEQRFYFHSEIPSIYSRAKIVLNLPLADDLNFRTFEAMSCGALLITPRVNNGQELLFQEGKHYVAFSSEEELYERVDYYLENTQEREEIASQGYAEILRANTLKHRINILISKIENTDACLAPIRSMKSSAVDKQYAWLYEYWRLIDPGFKLVSEAKGSGRPWIGLLFVVFKSIMRKIKNL